MPPTLRANSTTAICIPRQMPRNGIPVLAGDPRGLDLALDPALAEAARDQDPVGPLGELVGVELLGVDQLDLDLDAVVVAAVEQRLDDRLVGVRELHVLADERDPHRRPRRRRRGAPSASQSERSGGGASIPKWSRIRSSMPSARSTSGTL